MRSLARALPASVVALALLFLLPSAATAAEFRAGDRVTIGADEVLGEDLYVAGGTTVIDGTINGDLTVAGGIVEIRGTVTGSVNAAGGTVLVDGTVGGALRVMGGNVEVRGDVARDLVSTGGNVVIGSDATVGADVAGASGTIRIDGTVQGDVLTAAGELVVAGTVSGTIDGQFGRLRILDQATVQGDVRYASDREAEIDQGATIGGTTERRDPDWAGYRALLPENPLTAFLGGLLGLLVLGWILLLARPSAVVAPGARLVTQPLPALGVGLAAWFGQFLLLVLFAILAALLGQLAASFGGAFVIPFIVVLLAVIALVFVAQVWTAMAIGLAVGTYARGLPAWLLYAIGAAIWAAVLALLGFIAGGLGGFAFLLGWILGLGAFGLYQLDQRRTESATDVRPSASPSAPY